MQPAIARASAFTVLAILLSYPVVSPAEETVASIIQRSVEANNRDWAAVPEFDNRERDRTKDGDKTYAVTMLYGSPYQRLIAVNGQPVSAEKEREEQKKYQQAVAQRRHESPDKRAARIAKFEAERKRDPRAYTANVIKHFLVPHRGIIAALKFSVPSPDPGTAAFRRTGRIRKTDAQAILELHQSPAIGRS